MVLMILLALAALIGYRALSARRAYREMEGPYVQEDAKPVMWEVCLSGGGHVPIEGEKQARAVCGLSRREIM
ncbi:hypothetical protein V5O48_018648, partial [Marasmius crinis-equi]